MVKRLVMAGHDLSRAFDSGIYPQLLLSAEARGLNQSIVHVYMDMYSKLYVVLKVPVSNGYVLSRVRIRVWKGIRQGGVSSPPLYNNSVVEAQKKVITSFIFRSLDLSFANYADDVLNLSRTYAGIEENFDILSYEYKQIGLRFIPEKSEVALVGKSTGRSSAENIRLGLHFSKPSSSITYLGLPIGSSLKHTWSLLLEFLSERL